MSKIQDYEQLFLRVRSLITRLIDVYKLSYWESLPHKRINFHQISVVKVGPRNYLQIIKFYHYQKMLSHQISSNLDQTFHHHHFYLQLD